MRLPRFRRPHGVHSLRGRMTLANVALLAVGIIAATAVSLMGMRHYLVGQVDSEMVKMRDSLGGSRLTLRQIDSLSVLGVIRDRFAPNGTDEQPAPDSIFAAVDGRGEATPLFGIEPTVA
jgi:two-component system, OmpR family, sensor kinase